MGMDRARALKPRCAAGASLPPPPPGWSPSTLAAASNRIWSCTFQEGAAGPASSHGGFQELSVQILNAARMQHHRKGQPVGPPSLAPGLAACCHNLFACRHFRVAYCAYCPAQPQPQTPTWK